MDLKLEPEKFEEAQEAFMREITQSIRVKLVEGGLDGRQMEELTANIAFSIASIIDDTTQIESDGMQVKPYLTFRSGSDEIIHCGENSYTYEYVIGILKELFDV
jgi:hypothetical protein